MRYCGNIGFLLDFHRDVDQLRIDIEATSLYHILGAQPEIFQNREGFMGLEHFDKHFVKNTRKIVEFFLLNFLKTTF